MTSRLRYRVMTQVPRNLRDLGFVAYVEDSNHPDGGALSMSWHQSLGDADRVAVCMNLRELAKPAEREDAGRMCFAAIPNTQNLCTRPYGHAGDHRCLASDVDAEPPAPVDDGSCDPLYGQRMDSADCGEN
jgi:hypothetical protein